MGTNLFRESKVLTAQKVSGVSFLQLLDAIRTVTKANIIGADLNELAPTLDTTR